MSAFSRPDFVEEFAYRTKSNYYSLMIAQANEQKQPDIAKKYEQQLDLLKSDMAVHEYNTKDNYFEVTQLINSLIGLLVFPEQQYFVELGRRFRALETDLKTLNTIINKNNGSYFCSYKETQEIPLSAEDQTDYFGSKQSGIDRVKKNRVLSKVFRSLEPEEKTSVNILRHMRNAVSHERIGIIPVSRNEKVTSVVFEDHAIAKIERYKGIFKAQYTTSKTDRNALAEIRKLKQEDIIDGYFRLEIDVNDLEMVLMEICNAILRVAREG